ncbi:hypothetical protein B0T17DRAFT_599008 [Bombardia bombarda]|uniref:Uncharacterized protein n=1 Tax=Bombardia bombarda TaxID=252184 RepID=A0AA39XBJ3_9PEZI|nr:hypothetical protein B0T17DRAFT_599008 [Bombardia bombarda]
MDIEFGKLLAAAACHICIQIHHGPTAAEIKALLTQQSLHENIKSGDSGSLLHFGGLETIFADDIVLEIPGLGIKVQGAAKITGDDVHPDIPSASDVIHPDHPIETPPPVVIGGGDEDWATAILNSTAKTHHGKDWDHETVALIHFNTEGKIDLLRATSTPPTSRSTLRPLLPSKGWLGGD